MVGGYRAFAFALLLLYLVIHYFVAADLSALAASQTCSYPSHSEYFRFPDQIFFTYLCFRQVRAHIYHK